MSEFTGSRVRAGAEVPAGSTPGPQRWSVEQVEALASSPAAITTARPVASLARWGSAGHDETGLWGTYRGGGAEPYDVVVDPVAVAHRCSCPSRRRPCKHVLALLLMWARGELPPGVAPPRARAWLDRPQAGRDPTLDSGAGVSGRAPANEDDRAEPDGGASDGVPSDAVPGPLPGGESDRPPSPVPPTDEERDRARDERVERMMAGLVELDRWLEDRIRTGLADPSLAQYSTWDDLAARLVDARAGSLANRVRRLAGLVGATPDWHDRVLEELGFLHLLASAGRHLGHLPGALADAVATTVGWQVRRDDVLAGVPETDLWFVAGRSDTREDRIEVRRHWLRGTTSGRWAMLLSFAAYRQSLDTSWEVGTVVEADLHRYPGPSIRALAGVRSDAVGAPVPTGVDLRVGCDEIGQLLTAEPWLERVPAVVRAAVANDAGRWALTDHTGSLPLLVESHGSGVTSGSLAALLALSGGTPVDLTVEWTPRGVVPLAVHCERGSIDIGPRADPSFVEAA